MKSGFTGLTGDQRLDLIRPYHILDTKEEREYNDIVELASHACSMPMAVITLLDDKRQWFKARKGLKVSETDIQVAFCAHTVLEDDIMIVQDAHKDERFCRNPLVLEDPNIRFYAGIPVKSRAGTTIGSLAVMDTVERELTPDQLKCLKILSRQVEDLLHMRLINYSLKEDVKDKDSQLLAILNRISDGFIAVDAGWNITYCNEKAKRLNKRQVDLIGLNFWAAFPEMLATRFAEVLRNAFETQQDRDIEEYIAAYEQWLEAHFFPSASGLSIYFRDITERKRIEKELRETETNYRRLFEGNPQPMWIYDIETLRILEVNGSAMRKYGYNHDEFLQLTILQLRPKSEISKVEAFMQKADLSTRGVLQSGPWKHQLKDGTLIDVEVTSHPIIWQGRQSRFTLAWDVTQRLEMEQSLRTAEERYRTIFENASEGIYQSSADGKFITANPAMAKMFGYGSPDELMREVTNIGEQLYRSAADRDAIRKMLELEENMQGLELQMVKKNKEPFWTRSNVRAIKDENRQLKYYEGTMEDITLRKQAEEKLRNQFEELQKANQELDRFVYSVSHDLRAPLATILGLLHIAELESPSATFNEYLKMITLNIKRLDGFINDILDYSLNARKELQIEQINFHELVGDILKNFNFIASADRLQVNLQIDNTYRFYSDPYRIAIIFNNLLSNAIKYQDFTKERSFVSLDILTTPEKSVFTLFDNGIGIRREYIDKIFNMFFRASEVAKGSGLGLYIARETVTKLGGRIKADSEYGQWTKFEIELPNLQVSNQSIQSRERRDMTT